MSQEFRILKKTEYQRSTWKNGLGFTDQIAIHPPEADLRKADFLWRVSSARIEKDSPFSPFPEHDRILVILKGAGVAITHQFSPEDEPESTEVPAFEPYEFPGDIPTSCSLINGPVVDLSVFLKKGVVDSSLEVRESESGEAVSFTPSGRWNLVFVAEGAYGVIGLDGNSSGELSTGDSLRIDFLSDERGPDEGELRLVQRSSGTGKLLLLSLGSA